MYIEMFAGTGLVGGVIFLWFCRHAARCFIGVARHAAQRGREMLGAGVAAAGAAIALHGLVDSFLSFTATYILFAVTLALGVTCDLQNRADANRV
jgi:L-serine deaminase